MRIFVYGDSNSWGYLADGSGQRYARRWPVVMAGALGADLVEDCLPGRTTAHDDDDMGGTDPSGGLWNGLSHLEASLLAASPLDLVLIMLGTNDMKTRFSPSAAKIADKIVALAALAAGVPAGPGGWDDQTPAKVGVICPPPLGPLADDRNWDRVDEWVGGREASLGLMSALSSRKGEAGFAVFDARHAAEGSTRDPIHFEADQHDRLGRAVAKWYTQATQLG